MKLYFLPLLFLTSVLNAQPNPQLGYPKRIKDITEILKKDTLNYELIWERLKMEVGLLRGDWLYEPFNNYPDAVQDPEKLRIKEYEDDFTTIYNNVIKPGNYSLIQEGDFYLQRGIYFGKTRQFDYSIEDFTYIKDYNASFIKNFGDDEYLKNFSLDMLFNLHVFKNNYTQALQIINLKLESEKETSAEGYFSYANSSYNKIRLLENYDRKDELIGYLKQSCKEYFEYYFQNISSSTINLKNVKQTGYQYLSQLIEFMQKINDPQKEKYIEINQKLSKFNNLNPDLDPAVLKSIIEEI